jgi:membrane protein DedA with SNARE-associated domain
MINVADKQKIVYNSAMSFSASQFANSLITQLGLGGIAVGVFLNGLGVPGISEVLLPLAGVAVREGKMSLLALLPVALAAQMAGVSVAYAIARFGGIELVERYGKYILVSKTELDSANRALTKRPWLIVVGGTIPGIQGFIGYVGGLAELSYKRFFVSVLMGKLIWIGGLVGLGYALGNQVSKLDGIIRQFGIIVLVLVITFVVWYVWKHRENK